MRNAIERRKTGYGEILFDPVTLARKPELREFLENEAEALAERVRFDCLIVLGGDGTMLRAIRECHSEGLPFLGVNFGTKGFLMNRVEDVVGTDRFRINPYPLLDVEAESASGRASGIAFNEAQVKTAGGHMVTLDLSIGGHSEIRMRGDGFLVVTPAGTTGYNASAGGPILPHSSPLLVVTPLLPFEPKRAAPAVVEDSETVKIFHRAERGQSLSVFADSATVLEACTDPVEIVIRKRSRAVSLLVPETGAEAWKRKIFEEQGFRPSKSDS